MTCNLDEQLSSPKSVTWMSCLTWVQFENGTMDIQIKQFSEFCPPHTIGQEPAWWGRKSAARGIQWCKEHVFEFTHSGVDWPTQKSNEKHTLLLSVLNLMRAYIIVVKYFSEIGAWNTAPCLNEWMCLLLLGQMSSPSRFRKPWIDWKIFSLLSIEWCESMTVDVPGRLMLYSAADCLTCSLRCLQAGLM